jgi:hypothetical protein
MTATAAEAEAGRGLGRHPARRALAHLGRNPTLYALAGFAAGYGVGVASPLAGPLTSVLGWVVDGYAFVAPAVIYLILAPSLARLLSESGAERAQAQVRALLAWFVEARAAACLFAVGAVALLYRLPWAVAGGGSGGIASAVGGSLRLLPHLLAASPYTYAIGGAIVTALALRRGSGPWRERFLGIPGLVESFGSLFTHVVPLFTFLMGAYVSALPDALRAYFLRLPAGSLGRVDLLGLELSATSARGIFALYLAISLLTGVLTFAWHLLLLAYARLRLGPGFSVPFYLRRQFLRLFPLLWATCSEALCTPLNLYLMKRNYPRLRESMRHLGASLGSIWNVNGTMICCFVMVPLVLGVVGVPVSVGSLLLALPLIYLLGFGVPGIPGELVLFAGPIMTILAVPPAVEPVFLAAFVSLQFGLPDAFRSGINSTDNCPAALLVDRRLAERPAGPPGAAGPASR